MIPPELRAIVEFLNRQMSPADVLAIEIRQYVDDSGEHQTLVPRLIGDTQAARRAKGHTPRASWSEQTWLESFRDAHGDASTDLAKSTMSWARDSGLEVAFGTAAKPSALLKLPGRFTLITITHDRRIEIYMGYLQRAAPFGDIEERRELKARLEAIPDVIIDERRLDKFPSVALDAIAPPEAFSQFTDALEWVLARIEQSMR